MNPFRDIAATVTLLSIAMTTAAGAVDDTGASSNSPFLARAILEATGVKGGLIAHVTCGNGELTAALHINDSYLVHGLDRDQGNVETARAYIRGVSSYGLVSVAQWNGSQLPYADNLVNLLVVEDRESIPMEEVNRVLAPRGVAYFKRGDGWTKTVKPWPNDIDEWTHWLHGADGNAVAADRVVGPPRRMQWAAKPFWMRHHNTVPSTSAMVSSKGRLFYISDEAPASVDGTLPDRWFLVARNAFNGVPLWKRPIPRWGWDQWSSDWWGRFTQLTQLPKRLVAIGDVVYVTLNFNAPVTALDAATGEIIKTYEDTEHVDEILYRDGYLILSIYHKAQAPSPGNKSVVRKGVCVVDTGSGKVLWKHGDYPGLRSRADAGEPFSRLELIAGERHVFLVDAEFLIALDLKTGREVWRKTRPAAPEFVADRYRVRMSDQCALVYQDGVVLFAQPEMKTPDSWHTVPGTLYAYSADTGELKWKHGYGGWNVLGQPETFVINRLAWVYEHADVEEQIDGNKHVIVNQDKVDYAILGLDLQTGEVKRRFSTSETFNQTHHHRCYRGKATENFVMPSRRGVEFLDLKTEENHLNRWVRGSCLYGFVPANGLLYTAPHPCSCYSNEKLNGYFALAPEKQSADIPSGEEGLLKGPAYGSIDRLKPKKSNDTDWPTYRHDASRSGASPLPIPIELERAWSLDVGGNLSPPVVADGKLFVSSIDEHRVSAIDASKGKPIWNFTADGRVDTPPTIYRGLVLFGSADGWVYCLQGSDGQLVWKRRAAPIERLIGAYGQLESAWPVHGSVLVEDDKLYFAAGRSSFLDGGIFLFTLDPATGNILDQNRYDSAEAQARARSAGETKPVSGTLSEILVSDGSSIYMRQTRVFGDRNRERAPHLYSTSGLRDESWFHKSTWKFGPFNAARLLVFDGESVYGINAYASQTGPNEFVQNSQGSIDSLSHPGKKGYLFFAGDLNPVTPRKPGLLANRRRFETRWSARVPLRGSALVLAGSTLFAAGTPDRVDPDDPLGAFEGRMGGELRAFSTKDGAQTAFYTLDAAPVWDGMAAANGQLFLSCVDGNVICYRAQ